MSTKNNVHSSDVSRHQSNYHSRELLFVVGLVLVIALAVVLVNRQSGSNNTLSVPQMFEAAPEVTYRDAQAIAVDPAANNEDALARAQFTQPWTNPQAEVFDPASRYVGDLVVANTQPAAIAADAQYRDALAAANAQSAEAFSAADYDEVLAVMQFTQPWLNPDAEPADLASRYIEVQTMANTQTNETASTVDYREALEMSNTKFSLDKQYGDSTISYDEVLAILQFTQPWLNPQAEPVDLASRYIEASAIPND